MEAAMTIT